jgi:hypothetical protein
MPGTHVPARAGVVLTALLMAAAVCNLTTGGASVALPDIAGTFDAPRRHSTSSRSARASDSR